MKIYFSSAVRAGRQDVEIYAEVVKLLKKYGEVLTERNADPNFFGETSISDEEIFERDMAWLRSADVLVAEVTTPSLGVGYEIASVLNLGKPVIALYREIPGKRLSAMISGDKRIIKKIYKSKEELPGILEEFFK